MVRPYILTFSSRQEKERGLFLRRSQNRVCEFLRQAPENEIRRPLNRTPFRSLYKLAGFISGQQSVTRKK